MSFWVQSSFRLYDDDASPDSATPLAAVNTNASIVVDKTFFIRFLIKNTGSGTDVLENLQARYRIDKGAGYGSWDVLGLAAFPGRAVIMTASVNITDGESIAQLLGSGTFRDGEAYDVSRESPTSQLADTQGSDEYEIVFAVQLDSDAATTPAEIGDKIQFHMRVDLVGESTRELEQYDNIPEITVTTDKIVNVDSATITLTGSNVTTVTDNPFWQLSGFQFLNDDAAPDLATPLAGINTNLALAPNIPFRFHVLIDNLGGGPTAPVFLIYYRINGGAWTLPGLEGFPDDPIRLRFSGLFADKDPISQRLGVGTFVAGEAYEDDRSTGAQPSSSGADQYEFQWNMEIDAESTGVVPVNDDTIELKLQVDTGGGFADLDNVIIVPTLTVTDQAQAALAFPSAIGYGRFATGGRGGTVMIVTSSANSGPGTLREAVEASGPRIIVFRVNQIRLSSNLFLNNNDITIAGQSMPGGVELTDSTVFVRCENFILRGLSFRMGDRQDVNPSFGDSLQIGEDTSPGANNGIIDHCAIMWSDDENGAFWRESNDITLMNTLIAQGLRNAPGGQVNASRGLLVFGNASVDRGASRITIARNLFAFNNSRNPEINNEADEIEFLNNYVWSPGEQYRTCSIKVGAKRVTVRGNVFRSNTSTFRQFEPHIIVSNSQTFIAGNEQYNGDGSPFSGGGDAWHGGGTVVSSPAFPGSGAPLMSSSLVEAYTIANVGAYPDNQDEATQRVIDHALNYTGQRFYQDVADAGGYPDMSGFVAPPDSDNDGIPNAFEATYSDIEDYLNSIYGDAVTPGNTILEVTSATITLTAFDVGLIKEGGVLDVETGQVTLTSGAVTMSKLQAIVDVATIGLSASVVDVVYTPATAPPGARVWPPGLPSRELNGTLLLAPEDARAAFQPDLGPPITWREVESVGETLTMTMRLTDAQYATLNTFWTVTVDQGSLTFDFDHPVTAATRTARFVRPFTVDRPSRNHNLVSLQLYLEPV